MYAKGRFALIGAVIALMTFMVVALSALTAGLSAQSISAIERLPGQSIVLQEPAQGQSPSLAESDLGQRQVTAVTAAAGEGAAPLGVTTVRLTAGDATGAAAVFGADPRLLPPVAEGAEPGRGGILLSAEQAADLGVGVGDRVGAGEQSLRVDGIGAAGFFAHTPVAYTGLSTWRELAQGQNASAVVLLSGTADVPGTTALPMSDAVEAVPGYGSEHGSLLAMQALLLVISALVVGAFFAVWTVQRLGDLAVVRAMGASRGYLLRDGLGQAALVLIAGEAIGAAAGVALAASVSGVVPIALTAAGVAVPVVAMAVLAAGGALLAVRQVTVVDPLIAMSR